VQRKIIFDWDPEAEAEEAQQWYAEKNPVAARLPACGGGSHR
jgi:hypothetical protein